METSKLRLLYLLRILLQDTDDTHALTTSQLIERLKSKYGIDAHRTTISSDIEALMELAWMLSARNQPRTGIQSVRVNSI